MWKDNSFIKKEYFRDIDLSDCFFDNLKKDYGGFQKWFNKKANDGEIAFVSRERGVIDGFLYLKDEYEADTSIEPNFEKKRRLKVGTFKVDAHGTTLGENFIKLIVNQLYSGEYEEAYVTIFPKHSSLIELLEKYGFIFYGIKATSIGDERVYVKKKFTNYGDIYLDYPIINLKNNKKFLLSIIPKYHSRLFPYSKLNTEKDYVMEDISYTNSIEKVYIAAMSGIRNISKDDLLIIYRTAEYGKLARYNSVATSICTVVETKNIEDFANEAEFLDYCRKYSIFSNNELRYYWKTKKYPYIIKMLYNIALNKRIVRDRLIKDVGLDENKYWGVLEVSDSELIKILELGEVDESIIVN
ncbi:MAG: hypothetical protein AB2375_09470 [Tissierellaceae bacterium]